MRTTPYDSLNAGMLSKNCEATVQQFIAQDKSYNLTSSVNVTPTCWRKPLLKGQAVTRQLGILTFSMTLYCADRK